MCDCSASETETICKNFSCFLFFSGFLYLKGEVLSLATEVWCSFVVTASVRTIERGKAVKTVIAGNKIH